jgi:hypothetical protein
MILVAFFATQILIITEYLRTKVLKRGGWLKKETDEQRRYNQKNKES